MVSRQHVFGDDLELGVLMLEKDSHIQTQPVMLGDQLLLGRQSWQNLLYPRQAAIEILDRLFRRERWQKLLDPREPPIEIFEMGDDGVVVHGPHFLGKEGGRWTAILASSLRRNGRAEAPTDSRDIETASVV
jgi:hypothetical protein